MSWILFTLGAVILQTVRNALQSKLSGAVNTSGVTLSRFILAPPIALVYLLILYSSSASQVPEFSGSFIAVILCASLLQIAATSLMVILFKQKNFAIGAGLAKKLEHKHNVKLIEYSPERAKYLSANLDKTIVFSGDASDPELLSEENIEQVDAFIAVTNDDEANIMSAMLAKRMGAQKAMVLIQRSA